MVGGDERGGRADEVGFDELEWGLVVAVIECDQGEQAGEGCGHAEGVAGAEGLKAAAKKACGEAAGPLVEIADDEAWSGELRVAEDFFAEENACLAAALVQTGAEVHVEEVQQVRAELDIGLQRATLFAAGGEVVVVPGADGQAREGEVAVGAAVERAVRTKLGGVGGQSARDFAGLVVMMRAYVGPGAFGALTTSWRQTMSASRGSMTEMMRAGEVRPSSPRDLWML